LGAGAQPGALRSRTRGWLRLYSSPSGFMSRKWGLPPPHPGFARLVLQAACYSGHPSTWQEGAAAPTPPLLSCRRLVTMGNKALGRWGFRPRTSASRCAWLVLHSARYSGRRGAWQAGAVAPYPRFPLRLACLAGGSLPRATRRLAGGGCRPIFPLCAALGFCLAGGSQPRATARFAGWGCRPHTPAFRCARFNLQTARNGEQRNT
jgi:hypothetical protein